MSSPTSKPATRTYSTVLGVTYSGSACSNCGKTYTRCTSMILGEGTGKPCCGMCGYTDTHAVVEVPEADTQQELTAPVQAMWDAVANTLSDLNDGLHLHRWDELNPEVQRAAVSSLAGVVRSIASAARP